MRHDYRKARIHFQIFVYFLVMTGIYERTFVAIKPDGVQRRLVGEIIRRFEKKGFKLVGMKIMKV